MVIPGMAMRRRLIFWVGAITSAVPSMTFRPSWLTHWQSSSR
jgi:hypothetical protein